MDLTGQKPAPAEGIAEIEAVAIRLLVCQWSEILCCLLVVIIEGAGGACVN